MKDNLEEIRNLLSNTGLSADKIQLINERLDAIEGEINIHSHTKTLVEFSREINKFQKLEDIIAYAIQKMYDFLGHDHSLLFFSKHNQEDESLELKSMVGNKHISNTITRYYSEGHLPQRIPVAASHKSAVLNHQLLKLPSLRTLFMDYISQDTNIEWEEELGVSHYYGFGFSTGENLIAAFGILSNEEIKKPIFELFDLILNMLNSIIVQKAESEKTLTLYNHMTRILDISNYSFAIFNKDGKLLTGNETFHKLFSGFPAQAMNLHHKVFYNEIGLSSQTIEEIKNGYSINLNIEDFSSLFKNQISSFSGGNITPVITDEKQVEYYIMFLISKAEDNRLLRSMQLQEEKYQRIFHHIQDVYFEVSLEGTILEMSPSIERYFGQPREFFLGRNILEFYKNPDDRVGYLESLHKTGEVVNYKTDLQNIEGKTVHTIVTASIVDRETDRERIVGSLTDLSEQYQYLQKISESESKLRSLFENSPLGIMISNTNGEIVDINRRLLEMLGSPSKDETQKFNLFKLDNLIESGITDKVNHCIESGESLVFETKYKSYWSNEAHAKVFINPIVEKNKKTSMIVLMAEDISEIKEIDSKLHETQERLNDIYEKTNDLIYTMDFEGNFTSVNPIGEKWLGYKYDELQNHNMRQFISLDSAKRAEENIRKKLKGDTTQTSYEIEAYTRQGEKMILEVNSFLRFRGDKPIEVFGIARDITERKKHEDFIQTSLIEKEALNKEMHHRVKNNLQMILSLMKMHDEKLNDEKVKHAFNDISQKILAISAVHEDFYFSKNYKDIPFKKYLEAILCNAIENLDQNNHVNSKLDIGDINADIDTAIPVGLIVSELIHNSIHHAFNNTHDNKELRISMSSIGDMISLNYSDNGAGFDIKILESDQESSGIQLIKMLAENQLEGSFNFNSSEKGTEVQIEFAIKKH
ncbi:MAG: PAS domain S-box protein [Bacteroidales bacterium]|nr:PAS domain S-box protein [Bacteroidales bacterium]